MRLGPDPGRARGSAENKNPTAGAAMGSEIRQGPDQAPTALLPRSSKRLVSRNAGQESMSGNEADAKAEGQRLFPAEIPGPGAKSFAPMARALLPNETFLL